MHVACERGYVKVVKLLLEKRAAMDTTVDDGKSPLHVAALKGHAEVVELLLQKGAHIDAQRKGLTPLFLACERGHVKVVTVLLGAGADRTIGIDGGAQTPLHIAQQKGFSGCVALFE
jgi:ankyrin repeat protein